VLLGATAVSIEASFLFSDPTASGAAAFALAPGTTVGAEFTVGSVDIIVTDLGVYDDFKNGLAFAHDVGIWNLSSATPIASATVPSGTTGFLSGTYRFVEISPLTLSANTTYRIGALFELGTGLIGQGGSASFDPAISSADPQWRDSTFSSSLTRPDQDIGSNRWAANMQFTTVVPAPVPEPQTWGVIAATSLVGYAAVRRWRRSRANS
jgi:hypothetical protein